MTSLGFVLLPHSISNVPLAAEEVKFFPEELALAISIYFQTFVILVLGNRLKDKSLHNCVPFNWLEKRLKLFIWSPNNFVYIVGGLSGHILGCARWSYHAKGFEICFLESSYIRELLDSLLLFSVGI